MKLFTYQFSRRERILLALLAVVGIVLFSYHLVYGQQLPAYRQLKARLQSGQERLTAARQAAAATPMLAQKAEQARAAWEATRTHLGFTLQGTAAFLAAAQPQNRDVRVLAFRPRPVENRDPFRVYPYEVTASGPYPALQDYIAQLESLPALTAIHNLKVVARPGSQATVEASFIIDLYDLGDGNPVPGAVALFPTGRADGFAPRAPSGKEKSSGSPATGAPGTGAPSSRVSGTGVPGPVPGEATPGTLDSGPPVPPPPPAGSQGAVPPLVPILRSTGAQTPRYTLPRLARGGLVPGPDFQEPPAGDGDVWLEELRVLRNVGPFFVLDRPAALGGIKLGRSIGVNLSKENTKAELRVDLRGRYTRLQGYTGIDDSFANSSGKARVTILADGRQLYQGEIGPGDYPQYLELPLFRVQQLTFSLVWQEGGIGDYDQLLATLASIHFLQQE